MWMLSYATECLEKGICIGYHLDSHVFDLRHLNTNTKALQHPLQEARFVDNCAPMLLVESEIQLMLYQFFMASNLFDLTVSRGKTGVLYQPAPITNTSAQVITINGTKMTNMDTWAAWYHRMVLQTKNVRLESAKQAMHRVRDQQNIRIETKSVQRSSLLYFACSFFSIRTWNHVIESHHQTWNFVPCNHDQHLINGHQGTNSFDCPRHPRGKTLHSQTPVVRRAAMCQKTSKPIKETV